ncbi:MAG: hypothetical protein ABW145_05045, partial [Candidatus Thiodiazotropha sp.]
MNFATPEMKPVTVEAKFPNHGLVILEGVDTNTNSRNHFFGSFLVLRFFLGCTERQQRPERK